NPTPVAISGVDSVCENGGLTALSDATSGGTWSTANAAVASIDGAGNLYGTAVGTTTITYTSGSCFTTLDITVGGAPAAITGPGSVCTGDSATLSSASSGGVWSSSNPSAGSIITGTGVIHGLSTGTTTVTYSFTTSSGCYTTTIILHPWPFLVSTRYAKTAGLLPFPMPLRAAPGARPMPLLPASPPVV
ncbi:MAG: hypothetical protein EBZ77_05910, partial [Chitinophagia bacterium]|nr:hypothetical protein [Chitinophagia bacterium]